MIGFGETQRLAIAPSGRPIQHCRHGWLARCGRTIIGILLVLLSGCGPGSRQVASSPGSRVQPIRVEPIVVSPEQVRSVGELQAAGRKALELGQPEIAARLFERILRADPGGTHSLDAAFSAGLARDDMGDLPRALDHFVLVADRWPNSRMARAALRRALRLASALERWKLDRQLARRFLERYQRIRPFEAVLVQGALAMGELAAGHNELAEQAVSSARTVIEDQGLDVPGEISRDLAQVYFASGELQRIRAERIRFVPIPVHFSGKLEERCALILGAQASYFEAMRAHDAHWSSMAGYRISELYARLYEDLVAMPAPAGASLEKRLLFEGVLRLRYSILIRKALAMLSHTTEMAERTRERSEWTRRATAVERHLQRQLAEEERVLAELPYSRQMLQDALMRLQSKGPASDHRNSVSSPHN